MKKSTKRNIIATAVIVIVAIAGYYYIKDVEWKEEQELRSSRVNNELYKTLENRDTVNFIQSIELGKNTNILLLSKIFYKNDAFWGYIFEANNKIENPLDIPKGTVVKIPKIKEELLDTNSSQNMELAKIKNDSILETIQESRKSKTVY